MSREREISTERNRENPDEKMVSREKGIDFLAENSPDNKVKTVGGGGFDQKASLRPKRDSNLGSQELTLSYLCENSKLGHDFQGQNLLCSLDKLGGNNNKGKEIVEENGNNIWVERDFLQLSEERGNNSIKRGAENIEADGENREKKPKVEFLNLSLALPEVSLSLAGSNRVQIGEFPSQLRPSRSVLSLGPSYHINPANSFSTEFTAASLSYTCSHSHNPSCSITRNSTENYEHSMGSHQIWNAGEGTNGSVHSRFRPLGDGSVTLSNYGGAMNRGVLSKDFGGNNNNNINNNGLNYKPAGSENASFLPSELPARPRADAQSVDLRRNPEDFDPAGAHKFSKILREIVSESIPVMAQIIQELTEGTVESVKEYLKGIVSSPSRKGELESLQRRLERRPDLTHETLSRCQRSQLEILVSIKMGLGNFLSSEKTLKPAELIEIFVLERCRNVNCKRSLPVEDCDCKICSTKKGFCSECMCPVCYNFDSATQTCSWVGCDVCSHWCHAECGLEKGLIRPGPSLKGPSGTSEMQFNCPGCDHASEMFGFVRDVFVSCAKEWGSDVLAKELECVGKMFARSEDRRGKELHRTAGETIDGLRKKAVAPEEACGFVCQFFAAADNFLDLASSSKPSKDFMTHQPSFVKNASSSHPQSDPVAPPGPTFYDSNSLHLRQDPVPSNNNVIADEWSVKPVKRGNGHGSLDSLIRIKEAEVKMFQNKADEARRDMESLKQMMRINGDKLEGEYAEKLEKLCLRETEERRRQKLEELKAAEGSQYDYYQMKLRMQSEISGLLKRMEATKQQLV